MSKKAFDKLENVFEFFVFWARWIQAPIYGGLIIAAIAYTYKFVIELWHVLTKVHGEPEAKVMLGILTLVDMVMVINVLIMVIIGGYATFVSKLNIGQHEDRPAWLRSMDPGTLKVKLSASLVGVSGIHLLKTFVKIDEINGENVMWQSIIHLVFLVSAIGLAYSEKILHQAHQIEPHHDDEDEANGKTEKKGH